MSLADKDDALGPPALPMGTLTVEEGRGLWERVLVDLEGAIGYRLSASRRCRIANESSIERDTSVFSPANDLPAHNDEDGR